MRNRKKMYGPESPGADAASDVRESALFLELMQYKTQGVALWLDGRQSTCTQIAQCLAERSVYMRDYHTDGQNRICGIGFDRIREADE